MSIQTPFWIATLLLGTSSLCMAQSRIDVSTIIDKAAAESILDTAVKDPSPRNVEGRDGYYSKCNYYSATPGKLLILRVYQAAAGSDPKEALEQVRASTGLTKSLPGIGDKAELSSGTATGIAVNITMLYVVKGDSLITVGLRGLDEESAIAKARSIAQKILEHL